MKDSIHFTPVTPTNYQNYIDVGSRAYNQHYLHLWNNENSAPYINRNFTEEVLKKEESDANTALYLIQWNQTVVGILKITLDCALDSSLAEDAMYIDKIYMLSEYAGKGIGKKVIQFVALRAKEMGKKLIWLGSMQKGPALHFYLKNGFEIYRESKVPFETVKEEEKAMFILVKNLALETKNSET